MQWQLPVCRLASVMHVYSHYWRGEGCREHFCGRILITSGKRLRDAFMAEKKKKLNAKLRGKRWRHQINLSKPWERERDWQLCRRVRRGTENRERGGVLIGAQSGGRGHSKRKCVCFPKLSKVDQVSKWTAALATDLCQSDLSCGVSDAWVVIIRGNLILYAVTSKCKWKWALINMHASNQAGYWRVDKIYAAFMSLYAVLWGRESCKSRRWSPWGESGGRACLPKRMAAEKARAPRAPHLLSSLFCLLLSRSGLRQVMPSGVFVLQLQMHTSMIYMIYQDVLSNLDISVKQILF